ncbi:MAG TPA: hypothetical protein VK252_02265 [Solirubrobacteraceae bacterium]|nr:hypothetical protein [Solirubrobacteraceae bacterium]
MLASGAEDWLLADDSPLAEDSPLEDDSWAGVDASPDEDSPLGDDSLAELDVSGEEASWLEPDSCDWVPDCVDWGACAGGCSDCVEVVVECGSVLARLPALLPDEPAVDALIVLPGNAWAATSESTPVSVMLAAISQRFIWRSWPKAASRL